MNKLRFVDRDAWIGLLLDSNAKVAVTLQGLAGYYEVPSKWRVSGNLEAENLLYLVTEGGFEAEVDGYRCTPGPGTLLWVSPGVDFSFWLPKGGRLRLYRFRLQVGSGKASVRIAPSYILQSSCWGCRLWFDHIIDALDASGPYAEPRLRSLLVCLFTELFEAQEHASSAKLLSNRQQKELIQYFLENYRRRPRPAQLARHLNLSPDYFSRLFRRTYGQSPRAWLVEQRIRLATVRLLESDSTVSEIASELGYRDLYLFSRQFKNVTGASPLHYRQTRDVVDSQ